MDRMVLLFLLIVSTIFDILYRKIPNKLTVTAMITGLFYWFITKRFHGLTFSITGLAVGFLIFLLPYIAGGIGAGDVKLMMSIGALVGWKLTVVSALFTAIAGGLIAIGYIVFSKNGKDVRIRLFQIIIVPILKVIYRVTGVRRFLTWQSKYDFEKNRVSKMYIPYAIPIAIGTSLAVSGLFQGIINF